MGPTEGSGAGELTMEVRWRALRALGRLGDRVVPALAQALREDGDPRVREFAAEALGKVGRSAEEAWLALERASRGDDSPAVRRAARRAAAAMSGGFEGKRPGQEPGPASG